MSPTDSKRRALILSRPVVLASLVGGFALFFLTVLLVALSISERTTNDRRTAQAQHALAALAGFTIALTDATPSLATPAATAATVNGPRGRSQARREQARAELATAARHLPRTADVSALLAEVQRLTEAHFAQRDEAQSNSAAGSAPTNDTTAAFVGDIHHLVATLQRAAFAALADEAAQEADRLQKIQWATLALVVLGGSLAVALSFWLLRRGRDLDGLITVCAWTRRVLWQGRWLTFEEYLAKRFDVFVTHGICEEAAEKMRQEAANTPIPADFLH